MRDLRVLCIDPGRKAGYCYTSNGGFITAGTSFDVDTDEWIDELVIEDQFAAAHIYRDGKKVHVSRKSQMTLAHTAGRLLERYEAARKYRIAPDAWRRILWPGAVRLTKKVVLARLAPEYGHLVAGFPKTHQGDVLESIGIAMAWAKLTAKQKEGYRVE